MKLKSVYLSLYHSHYKQLTAGEKLSFLSTSRPILANV